MRRLLFLLLIAAACAASACAPAAGGNTLVPTLTLIPATATLTPTIAPPTATPSNLLEPQDVLRPTATSAAREIPPNLSGSDLVAQDPVAAELVGIAQRVVAADLDLPVRRIRLIDVRAVVWTNSALNCPPPETEPLPQEIDGYRIVLGAGEQEFLFHTDVDRVLPCDPDNEALPEGILPEATPEATGELTPEATAEATES